MLSFQSWEYYQVITVGPGEYQTQPVSYWKMPWACTLFHSDTLATSNKLVSVLERRPFYFIFNPVNSKNKLPASNLLAFSNHLNLPSRSRLYTSHCGNVYFPTAQITVSFGSYDLAFIFLTFDYFLTFPIKLCYLWFHWSLLFKVVNSFTSGIMISQNF